MAVDFVRIFDESINIELNISDIYLIFHKDCSEDADFWWQLLLEEKNHAALIKSGKEEFYPLNKFPEEMLSKNFNDLKETNTYLISLKNKYKESTPSRMEALKIAYDLEHSTGEAHFQKFMEFEEINKIGELFQNLNKLYKDHARRIKSYREKANIK